MTERATIMRAKLVAAGLALVAVLVGAEYVRAEVHQPGTDGTIVESASPAGLGAAELPKKPRRAPYIGPIRGASRPA